MLNMTSDQFIDALGGTFAVAALLQIRPPSVSGWRDGRNALEIPSDKLIRLACIAEERGIASRQDLRPNDWQQIWPELAAEIPSNPATTEA